MVETLAPGALSVATVDGDKRGFASVQRVVQRLLAKSPALYDSITTRTVIEVIRSSRDKVERVQLEISTTTITYRLIAVPVLGPTGLAHAVQFWLGRADEEVDPPRRAFGMTWDLDTQTMLQSDAMAEMFGRDRDGHGASATSIAELFHRASRLDRHGELLALLYHPKQGDTLQFDVVAGQLPRQWRVTVRARDDKHTRGAWWLWEDVTEESLSPKWPTLEQFGLREAHRRAGNYLAVVQLAHTSITHWLTDPAPWIRWDGLTRPVDVFHPEDRARLRRVAHSIRTGVSIEMTVRLLNYDGGYTPTTLMMYPYPGCPDRQLVITQFAVAADDTVVVVDDQWCLSPSGRTMRSRPYGHIPNIGSR